MDTVSKLSRYAEKTGSDIRFMGIPKTIDNDLVKTDHTPGFGSAAKYVASTVRRSQWTRLCMIIKIGHHRGDHGTPRGMADCCQRSGAQV